MPDVLSTKWLYAECGPPSGRMGSKYTKIYRAMEAYEKAPTQARLEEVGRLTLAWGMSRHKRATTDDARELKREQQLRLNRFFTFVVVKLREKDKKFTRDLLTKMRHDDDTYPVEKAIIEGVIDDLQASSLPILANTGQHLIGIPVIMRLDDRLNGTMSLKQELTINPVLAYQQSVLIGTIVHECHHMLCRHNGNYLYLDEFSAHVKQFRLTRAQMSDDAMIDLVGQTLDHSYAKAVKRWLKAGNRLVEDLDDLGDFAVPDNATAVDAFRHGCKA